jgi:hypothetical protein
MSIEIMDNARRFDPRLLIDANRSFSWIFKCRNVFVARRNDSLRRLLAPHMHGDACDLINPGLVLAACYIYFVYPKETALMGVDLSTLDTSGFKLSSQVTPVELIRRIRNSLSHGRFEIDDRGVFTLRDRSASGTDLFETQIHFSSLGEFAEQFAKLILKSFPPHIKAH